MYYQSFKQIKKSLVQMDHLLTMAGEYAKSRSFDGNVFLSMRLAPDQFSLDRQIGIACDTAKLGASRLTGKDAPSHSDDQKTLDEMHVRFRSVIAYLDGFSEKDFAGAATRSVTTPRWEGKTMTGEDYFLEHVQPNFFFHFTHTYAILRHGGVPVGKKDFLGALTQKLPS